MKEKKKLGRPRNSDTLPIPRGALKQIKLVAEEAKIPVSTVFEDVIENGLITVRDMYKSVIEFRKTRRLLNEPQPDEQVVGEQSPDQYQDSDLGPGDETPEVGGEFSDDFRGEPEPESGHNDDLERSGLGENGEVIAVLDEERE